MESQKSRRGTEGGDREKIVQRIMVSNSLNSIKTINIQIQKLSEPAQSYNDTS